MKIITIHDNNMEKTNQYFKTKIINDKFVVTNSALRCINPDQGGSPEAFLAYFKDDKTEEQSVSMERGSIIHSYHENPDEFIISEKEKPAEGIVKWIDEINNALKYINKSEENFNNYFEGLSPTIKYKGKKDQDIENENEEFLNTAMLFSKILENKIPNNIIDLNKMLIVILASKEYVNYNNNLTTIVALEQLKAGLDYFQFLQEAEGKIMLTVQEKEKIENSIKSIEEHPVANSLLFDNINLSNQYYTFKEHYIIYETPKFFISGLLDNFHLDYNSKRCIINDLKTTYDFPLNYLPNEDYKGKIKSMHIDRQVSYYRFLVEKLLIGQAKLYNSKGEEIKIPILTITECQSWNMKENIIIVQTQDFYKCIVVQLPNMLILERREYIKSLWNRIAWHIDNNEWKYTMEEILNGYIYKM